MEFILFGHVNPHSNNMNRTGEMITALNVRYRIVLFTSLGELFANRCDEELTEIAFKDGGKWGQLFCYRRPEMT
jgi:hypothetical protein